MIACHQFMDIPSEISENCLNKLAKNQQREREVRELLEYIYIYIYTHKNPYFYYFVVHGSLLF